MIPTHCCFSVSAALCLCLCSALQPAVTHRLKCSLPQCSACQARDVQSESKAASTQSGCPGTRPLDIPFPPWRRRLVVLGSKCTGAVLLAIGCRVRVTGWENVEKGRAVGAVRFAARTQLQSMDMLGGAALCLMHAWTAWRHAHARRRTSSEQAAVHSGHLQC